MASSAPSSLHSQSFVTIARAIGNAQISSAIVQSRGKCRKLSAYLCFGNSLAIVNKWTINLVY